jgi:hypothetical protein
MRKKYTFDDWWNGAVTLIYASTVSQIGEEITRVDWSDFIDSDVVRIKAKQQEIFEEKVQDLMNRYVNEFNRRYQASKTKKRLLQIHRRFCNQIMFSTVPPQDVIYFPHWTQGFKYAYLTDIQQWVSESYVNGQPMELGFIHSPLSKFEDDKLPDSRVYGSFVWEYANWLNNWLKSETNVSSKSKSSHEEKWFPVGLAFANGTMDALFEEHKVGDKNAPNCTEVAKQLGNPKSLRPYISESYANTNIGDKNIFSQQKKIDAVIAYCDQHNITIVESFHQRIKKAPKTLKIKK